MFTVHTLASSSAGNALLISHSGRYYLLDAGISCRRLTAGLTALGCTPGDLSGIFITHTHTDHVAGLAVLSKKTQCPIYATERTCLELAFQGHVAARYLEALAPCRPTAVDSLLVTAVPASHDAPGTCGYRLDTDDGSAGFLTDTGFVTEEAGDIFPGVDFMLLEANHDLTMLENGPYPYSLRRRVAGREGHLSNEDSARFALTLAEAGARQFLLAHLSRDNNTPALALETVNQALHDAGVSANTAVAPRDTTSETYFVTGRSVCRK